MDWSKIDLDRYIEDLQAHERYITARLETAKGELACVQIRLAEALRQKESKDA